MTPSLIQNIPTNYKQTEVGIVPIDWEVKELGDLVVVKDGTHQTPKYVDNGIPFYSVENVSKNDFVNTKFISSEEHRFLTRQYHIEKMDILMTRIGSIGDCKLVTWDPNASFYVSLALLKPKNKLMAPYIYHFTGTKIFQKGLEDRSLQWAIPKKINLGEISKVIICIPSCPEEQTAIATVLSDIDSLIASFEKLIAKKRAIKQGAMQELLTGKRRLPGFLGKWSVKNLGILGQFRGGNGFPIRYQGETEGDYPFYKVSDMNNEGNSTFMSNSNNWISIHTCKDIGAKIFPAHTVVLAKIGAAIFLERKKILFQDSCIDNNMMGFVLNEDQADYRFVHYLLLNIKLGKFVSATALPSLNGRELSQLEYNIPAVPEQAAIAEVIADMDIELDAIEQQLTKYKLLKQGMMQSLLTGKIRLLSK